MEDTLVALANLLNIKRSDLDINWSYFDLTPLGVPAEYQKWVYIAAVLIYLITILVLHSKEKVTFFYSYLDISIVIVTPLTFLGLNCAVGMEWLSADLSGKIGLGILVFALIFLWFITYRSNKNSIIASLFVFPGKIIAGLYAIIVFGLAFICSMFDGDRKKYERRTTYKKEWIRREEKH
ncbi:hypothetical protein A4G20_03380 [Pasteurellaceae bacterium RH1A]|nr:hypothetical protein A4G20_03380 [Pasteurellaceae bacterium RH1A]